MLTYFAFFNALTLIFFSFALWGLYKMSEAKKKSNNEEKQKFKKYFILFLILGTVCLIFDIAIIHCYFKIMNNIVF